MPVVVTINGVSIRTSAVPMGDGRHQISVNKPFQTAAGVAPGDRVRVQLAVDAGPRAVAVPPDLARALARSRRASEGRLRAARSVAQEGVHRMGPGGEEARDPAASGSGHLEAPQDPGSPAGPLIREPLAINR